MRGFTGLAAKPLACGNQSAYNGMASAVFPSFPQHLYRAFDFVLDKWALHNGRFSRLPPNRQHEQLRFLIVSAKYRATCRLSSLNRKSVPRGRWLPQGRRIPGGRLRWHPWASGTESEILIFSACLYCHPSLSEIYFWFK